MGNNSINLTTKTDVIRENIERQKNRIKDQVIEYYNEVIEGLLKCGVHTVVIEDNYCRTIVRGLLLSQGYKLELEDGKTTISIYDDQEYIDLIKRVTLENELKEELGIQMKLK